MKKLIFIAVAVLGALAASSCGKETRTITERVEVLKGNLILSGVGAPDASLGKEGDYYLDLSTSNLYGAKTAEGWGNPISLKGIQGDKGTKGDKGDTGDTGQKGAKGDKGDTGDTGAKGDKGDKGDTGAKGTKGDTGDTGAKGSKGDKGDTGATGPKGDTGATGAAGGKGDTGAQGTPGLNNSKIYTGTGFPAHTIGAVGDWYIDAKNKRLYGPKETSGWKTDYINLNVSSEIRDTDYYLEYLKGDNVRLADWYDEGIRTIDMNRVPALKKVTIIGESAFSQCKALESIVIGENVLEIGYNSISNKLKLKTVILNERLTEIGGAAFLGCTSLTSITIPKNVNFIDQRAFEECSNLKTFIIEATTPPEIRSYSDDSIFSKEYVPTIYVPAGSVEAYKTAEGWKQYADKIKEISKLAN